MTRLNKGALTRVRTFTASELGIVRMVASGDMSRDEACRVLRCSRRLLWRALEAIGVPKVARPPIPAPAGDPSPAAPGRTTSGPRECPPATSLNCPAVAASKQVTAGASLSKRERRPAANTKSTPKPMPVVQRVRPCITCRVDFPSTGVGHRMCGYCRQRASDASPYTPSAGGDLGRRVGARRGE